MFVLIVFTLLIIIPAVIAFLSETSILLRTILTPGFGIGAPIVYLRQEINTRPGSDAHDIRPSERGEFYYYSLINYLRVTQVMSDGRIIAVNRDNKCICLSPNDPDLRKARVTERLIYRRRFPHFCG
jgi:hypothetical protein